MDAIPVVMGVRYAVAKRAALQLSRACSKNEVEIDGFTSDEGGGQCARARALACLCCDTVVYWEVIKQEASGQFPNEMVGTTSLLGG